MAVLRCKGGSEVAVLRQRDYNPGSLSISLSEQLPCVPEFRYACSSCVPPPVPMAPVPVSVVSPPAAPAAELLQLTGPRL